MYSAVDARTREIATLRALGFGGTAVVVSVMVEALALAVPGALIGAAYCSGVTPAELVLIAERVRFKTFARWTLSRFWITLALEDVGRSD